MQENHPDCPRMENLPWFWDLVAMSSQIPLCLPNLLTQVQSDSTEESAEIHAWLVGSRQSRNKTSLCQWQHKLRLLNLRSEVDYFEQNGALVMETDQPQQTRCEKPPIIVGKDENHTRLLQNWIVSIE